VRHGRFLIRAFKFPDMNEKLPVFFQRRELVSNYLILRKNRISIWLKKTSNFAILPVNSLFF
jgi:hypothetical protein